MTRYLAGTTHHIMTRQEAELLVQRGDASYRQEEDGTFTVYWLSPRPLQPGQPPWRGP